MENNVRSHMDDWIDFKQSLTVLIWNCFSNIKSEGELDSDRINDVKTSIENLNDFFDYKVINHDEFVQWLDYLKYLDNGDYKDVSVIEENFNKFIKLDDNLNYEDKLKNMDVNELITEVKSFILDYEFCPIKSAFYTPEKRDKVRILMEATTVLIQKHLDSLATLKPDVPLGLSNNKHFWDNSEPQIQKEIDLLYNLRFYADDLECIIKKLYENEGDIPENLRDWRLNIVCKLYI
ncbi:MAG: hypothetical protein ABSE83_09810 [Methanobacterium sp.]|jgi:hypothetical protein